MCVSASLCKSAAVRLVCCTTILQQFTRSHIHPRIFIGFGVVAICLKCYAGCSMLKPNWCVAEVFPKRNHAHAHTHSTHTHIHMRASCCMHSLKFKCSHKAQSNTHTRAHACTYTQPTHTSTHTYKQTHMHASMNISQGLLTPYIQAGQNVSAGPQGPILYTLLPPGLSRHARGTCRDGEDGTAHVHAGRCLVPWCMWCIKSYPD